MGAISDFWEIMTEPANRAFFEAYGGAMASWGQLEHRLAEALARLTGMSLPTSSAIFYSANSFAGRSAMVMASIPFAKTIPAGRSFLTKAVLLANEYALTRNALAHDHHHLDWPEGELPRWMIRSPRGQRALDVDQIRNAGRNFSDLNQIIAVSWRRGSRLLDPELSLELLDLVPRDAASPPADPSALDRLAGSLQELCGLDRDGLYARPLR